MQAARRHLNHLYRGTFLFGLACGISLALTPLFLDEHGYSKQQIGLLATFFATGLVLFGLPVGAVIRRFSGKRTLTTLLVGYALCVGLFPFMPGFGSIGGIRFLDGVFSIGVWVSSETILLSRIDKEHKAHLTSLYAVWLASGYVIGSIVATVVSSFLSIDQTYVIAGLIALGAALYLGIKLPSDADASDAAALHAAARARESDARLQAASDAEALAQAQGAKLGSGAILGRIKTSCFAAFSYGYFQAAVVLFLPLFLIESKGIPRDYTKVLPGIFCTGMLLFSNLAGRWADRAGHLRVITRLSSLGMLCVLGFVFLDNFWLMCVAVLGAGATFASMSPIALALTGVVIKPRDLSQANSIYNVFYASGMLIGPPVASVIFQHYGGEMMLYHLGALWLAFILFCLVFRNDDPANGALGLKAPSAAPIAEA